MSNSLVITSVTPLEKRPCHPKYAAARGAAEAYEEVYVIRGFTDGHIHSPIIYRGRYFRPFVKHSIDVKHTCTVQVLLDDPKNPFKGGDVSKYPGIVQMYENVSGVRRPVAGNKFVLRELMLTLLEPKTQTETKVGIKNVLAWRSGSDPTQPQPSQNLPFCVKAVELTQKEITSHQKLKTQHARIPL